MLNRKSKGVTLRALLKATGGLSCGLPPLFCFSCPVFLETCLDLGSKAEAMVPSLLLWEGKELAQPSTDMLRSWHSPGLFTDTSCKVFAFLMLLEHIFTLLGNKGTGKRESSQAELLPLVSSHSAATMVLCIRGDGHHAAPLWGLASGQSRSCFFAFLNAKQGWAVAGCSPVRKPYPLLWICCSPGLHMAFPGHQGQEGRGWQYIWHLGCYFHCLGFPGVWGDTA